jgi:hypothetical protein
MKFVLSICAAACFLMLLPAASAQYRRDPLNPPEIDQLRDTAIDPELRLKLYVQFARARLLTLEQVRNEATSATRGRKTHDAVENFLAVYDELNENIDNFLGRTNDIRKPLKDIIAADTDFQSRLRSVRDSAGVKPAEYQQYEYSLTNAIETVDASADDHRKTLVEQEEQAKKKKLKKPD